MTLLPYPNTVTMQINFVLIMVHFKVLAVRRGNARRTATSGMSLTFLCKSNTQALLV